MLENSSPRAISVDGQRPTYLFTDACYNPQDDWKCGIGGMLFNHKCQLLAGFSHKLGSSERIMLGEGSSDTIIMAAEFVAVVCAVSAWLPSPSNCADAPSKPPAQIVFLFGWGSFSFWSSKQRRRR